MVAGKPSLITLLILYDVNHKQVDRVEESAEKVEGSCGGPSLKYD